MSFRSFTDLEQFRRTIEAHVPRKVLRDIWNMLRFGLEGPRSDAAIYVAPSRVNLGLGKQRSARQFRRQNSGAVVAGDWDLNRFDIETNTKLRSCRMHWQEGADWQETPIYQRLVKEIATGHRPDGCATIEDVHARYAALDKLYAETRQRGRLLPKAELPDYFRREHGGVLVHVARDGTCLRSGGGAHRFAIARILGLPEMPAQIGVVHPDAIRNGHLAKLLRSSFGEGGNGASLA
ncbi:hypothetical protein [Mameliella sediminis]|uniref:hypothetical protein n=1 Tax=Mameliella sediminis TaxID=2836866 RepID=UPI001C449495|nr:hypothetical protein [Mameliella sediminis]MBV7395567.1 hypothetical protein [Mameliella sediminis]